MKNLIETISKLWWIKVRGELTNPNSEKSMKALQEVLAEDLCFDDFVVDYVMEMIQEKRQPGEVWKTSSGWAGLKPGETSPQYGMKTKDEADAYVGAGDDEEEDTPAPADPKAAAKDDIKTGSLTQAEKDAKDDEEIDDGGSEETDSEETPLSGITSESIDSIDGDEKNKTMNGEDPPPGTESSAVAEIGTGYAMSCLADNNNDYKSAEQCLEKKLSESKLGKKHGTGSSKKEIRRGMLLTAKRENQKVKQLNNELGWENSETSHIGGSKSSLEATVASLRDKGIKKINDIPIDEYEEIILGGGAGENPTDTMVCIVNQETGEAIMYHTSNKMTSADQIANGSPAKEIREITKSTDYSEEEQKLADSAGETRRKNIGKHREAQKKYIQQQQDKMIEDSKDPNIARRVVDRLKGVKNPITDSTKTDKYWTQLKNHKSVKTFMKENGYDSKNLTPEQEIEVYQFYVEEMKNITDMDNAPESRRQGGVGDADIQILTRTYGHFDGKNQEQTTTGNSPKDPIFDNEKMQSFYDLQTEEINGLRDDMNKIKEGSGDKAFSIRMAKRLHLDMAEGHNPGGIPNDKAETIMGVYDYKDLKVDGAGNMVQKKGKKFYKLDGNGKITDEEVDSADLKEFDSAVVADKGTMSACLGIKTDGKVSDDMGITMGEYEGRKAIIYDRDGNQIGVQTARSKSGPGGSMQDSIAYHKDFQRCLAKQTKLQGKGG
jgi:hypothetical protein